jgi:hypothetical protein
MFRDRGDIPKIRRLSFFGILAGNLLKMKGDHSVRAGDFPWDREGDVLWVQIQLWSVSRFTHPGRLGEGEVYFFK